jgi:hypothetical protein
MSEDAKETCLELVDGTNLMRHGETLPKSQEIMRN